MYLCVCRRNIRLHTAQKTLLQIGLHESASLSKTTAACLSKVSPQRMDLASDFLGESSGSNQPPACFHATRTLVDFFFFFFVFCTYFESFSFLLWCCLCYIQWFVPHQWGWNRICIINPPQLLQIMYTFCRLLWSLYSGSWG